MVKKKRIDSENIPQILEKITAIIDREVDVLAAKADLSHDDRRDLLNLQAALGATYREYRAEVKQVKEDMKGMSKEQIQQIIKVDSK